MLIFVEPNSNQPTNLYNYVFIQYQVFSFHLIGKIGGLLNRASLVDLTLERRSIKIMQNEWFFFPVHQTIILFLIKTLLYLASWLKDRDKRLQKARYRPPNSTPACHERAASRYECYCVSMRSWYLLAVVKRNTVVSTNTRILGRSPTCSLSRRTCWLLLWPCYLLQYLSETLLVYVTGSRMFFI